MHLKSRFQKLEQKLMPKRKLEVKVIYSIDEVTDIDDAIWVLFTI